MSRFAFDLRAVRRTPVLAVAIASLAAFVQTPSRAADACMAKSTRGIAPVVELYTSEGCNSCPPADQWLSKLKSDPNVVALAFHVDYWDRLGWKDRFASAIFTERQAAQQSSNGARFSYTPQVVVDGQDRKDWWSLAAPFAEHQVAPVEVVLTRDGDRVMATVATSPRSPKRLAAYWAVTEQGHVTAVKAGENQGATLHHDFVVRDYKTVPAWSANADSAQTIVFTPATRSDPAHPRQVNLVVLDADTGRPVQAVKIAC